MSLDVYLKSEYPVQTLCSCNCCGNEHFRDEYTYFYDANVTHNLGKMASEAGLYEAVWRPEENGYTYASDIVDVLTEGIKRLKENPEHYKSFNPDNGWGSYDHFVPWLEEYLEACKKFPSAAILACR